MNHCVLYFIFHMEDSYSSMHALFPLASLEMLLHMMMKLIMMMMMMMTTTNL